MRRSIHCILPPHILREMARRGNAAERDAALNTMALDTTHRMRRQIMASAPLYDLPAITCHKIHRSIFTADHSDVSRGQLVRAEGSPPVADAEVNEAYDGLGHTFDFYLSIYQRDSIDNRGLPLNATVHYGQNYDNAFWDGSEMIFGDGDGTAFNRFTIAVDVIGHELTHGGSPARRSTLLILVSLAR